MSHRRKAVQPSESRENCNSTAHARQTRQLHTTDSWPLALSFSAVKYRGKGMPGIGNGARVSAHLAQRCLV